MENHYFKEYSQNLNRDMEFEIWGHAGKLCFAFAPQDGHFYDFKNNGMIDCAQYWIDKGELMIVLVDSIDKESWTNYGADPRYRIEMQERWFHYVTDELVPRCYEITGSTQKALTTGCSMGAYHAGNFYFRRPDIFDGVIAMSGTYDADMFFGSYTDDLTYANSPARFLANMPEDHFYMNLYKQANIIICIGQGNWEWELLPGTRELDRVCKSRGIPAWFDYWGFDCYHDWPWWHKQFPYFLSKIFNH